MYQHLFFSQLIDNMLYIIFINYMLISVYSNNLLSLTSKLYVQTSSKKLK